MSYRVETASTGRAGCKATECKNAGIKIEKNELRLGVWVLFEDRGSWAWRHWGCVSGKQLENLRNYLEDPQRPGVYRWDYLDGYEGDEKNSLDKHPDLQEKVRRVITQGFIDPEDFNGDPEMNRLGESGLRTAASKKQMKADQKSRANEAAELKAREERDNLLQNVDATVKQKVEGKKKPAAKKRGLAKEESDDEEAFEDKKPTKKKRATKAKKEKHINKQDDISDSEAKPKTSTKRSRKSEVKEEDVDISDEPREMKSATAKRGRKTAVKNEAAENQNIIDDSKVKPRTPPNSGRKETVKKEEVERPDSGDALVMPSPPTVKGEPSEALISLSDVAPEVAAVNNIKNMSSQAIQTGLEGESYIRGIKDVDLQYSFDNALDAGQVEDDWDAFVALKKKEFEESKPTKKGVRGKKVASKATAPKSTRASRNRTASQI